MWVHSFVLNPLQYQIIPPQMSFDTHLIPSNADSILLTTPLRFIAQFSYFESLLMELLLAGAVLMALAWLVLPLHSSEQRRLSGWWRGLLNSPQRKGLLILLAWQATFGLLLRHSIPIYIHYFIYLLPGPFILIGVLLANATKLLHYLHFPWERAFRYGLYGVVSLLVLVQTVGSAGWLIDHARGNFNSNYAYPQYFDLATVQRIVNDSDHLARQRHLSRVYIDIHGDDENAVSYMAQFASTPMEVLDSNQCLVLPDTKNGPVVYVTDPNRPDLDALLKRYADATQVGEIQHPGGMPFKVYILSARAQPLSALQLSGGVQLLSQQADVLSTGATNPELLVTHWMVQNTVQPQPRVVYKYRFLIPTNMTFMSSVATAGNSINSNTPVCRLSRTWAGDDLIPLLEFNGSAPQHITMGIEKFTSLPQHYNYGALKMVTYDNVDTRRVVLHTTNGKSAFDLSLSHLSK
jgi:hypothetical protein